MYNVVFETQAREQLDTFIHSILVKNLSLFEDSGIDDIAFIEENYLKNSELLRKKILSEIHTKSSSTIIWKMSSKTWEYFSFSVASFRIFIQYSEDISERIRYIESIEFYRK